MVDLYANYDETTASRIVRWHPSKPYAEVAIWDPPASFAGTPRPVYVFKSGGARQAKRDFRIGSAETSPGVHTVAGMMTNELGAFVCVYATPPGGIDFEAAEELGQEYAPECRLSDAMPLMFLRGNTTNPTVVGSTHTMQTATRYWCGAGTSAGVFDNLGAQMVPPGDFREAVDADAQRGHGQFRYHWDHRVGHFIGAIGQSELHTFCEYVVDDAGASTYVTGAASAGASTIPLSGDTILLYRANRLSITTTTSYVTTGTMTVGGTSSFTVSGSSTSIPAGAFVQITASDLNDYEFLVGADYAGGVGAIDARDWTDTLPAVDIPAGTAVRIRYEYAVTADYAGGSGSVGVWPTVQFPIASSSPVELMHMTGEGYGADSWAVAYTGTKSMGRVWRSDDASGLGVPLMEKYDASIGPLVVASNPRAYELNLMISGAYSEELQRVDSLTHERSFWARRSSVPAILPEHISLHASGDMAYLMHKLYVLRAARSINVAGLAAYLGSRRDNPTGTGVEPANQPYLLGRNSSYSAAVVKAFLTDGARFGGAFA